MPELNPNRHSAHPSPKMRLDTHRPVSIDEIERRLRTDRIRDRLNTPVHRRIGPKPSVLDDLYDIWLEIRASWSTHLLVGAFGVAVGCLGTVGSAWLFAELVL